MKKIYKGIQTKEISFPLGGIGTGSIGLAGNGRLIDWEIYNRPNERSFNGFSHFAVKAEVDGKLLDALVLNGDLQSPYIGEYVRGGAQHSGYGYGPESNTMAGMPHFKEAVFGGKGWVIFLINSRSEKHYCHFISIISSLLCATRPIPGVYFL
jgi:non-lysosomal glucosylceramidase